MDLGGIEAGRSGLRGREAGGSGPREIEAVGSGLREREREAVGSEFLRPSLSLLMGQMWEVMQKCYG